MSAVLGHDEWQPGTNGGHWYVIREGGRKVLSDRRGNYRRFGSRQSAQRAADVANQVQP